MPTITALTSQKTKKDRVNVFIDGKFSFGTTLEIVLKNNLKINQNITEENLSKIISENKLDNYFDKTLNFLTFRPRSQKEIEDYLAKKISKDSNITFGQARESHQIVQIVSKLKKYKYINDKEFTDWLITAIANSKKGPRVAKMELYKKGISKEISNRALENFPNQLNLAKKAIEKKWPRWNILPPLKQKEKVYRYLLSRGFETDIVKKIFASLIKKS